MNRWLRCFCVLVVLYSVLNPAWAICENEERAYARVLSERSQPGEGESRARDISKNWYEQCKARSQKENENVVMSAQENLRALQDKTGIGNREMTAALNTSICIVKYCIAGNSNSQTTQALPAQQQAEQDSRVTGPKEDCSALIRSAKPEQMHEVNIACIKRNGSRDRNAATVGRGNSDGAKQNQAAQQQSQQAQQQAQQTQARADQARQGKRKRHEPENEASQCIQPDFGGLYGGMKNTCNFKVWYTYCGYRPKENSWLTGMSCEKQSFGSDSVGPGRTSAAHTKGVEMLYWIACKEPAWTVDTEFVPGQGIKGRCHTVGG